MSLAFLTGPTIVLRPLGRQDLTLDYVQWLNDEEVCQFNSHAVFPYTAEKMNAYYEGLQTGGQRQVVLAVCARESGTHLGNVSLQAIDWVARSAEFAILLGHSGARGRGVGKEASALIVDYGFRRLNLHRIFCGTSVANLSMQRLADFLGMQKEGLRRQAMYKNGQFFDIQEYGVLRDEFYASVSASQFGFAVRPDSVL